MDWIKQIAPLLGTALAGPLGGAAASFIADKLGVKESTVQAVTDVLNSGKLSPDQLASLKAAELDFKKFCEEHKLDPEKLDAADRANARDMQKTTGSKIPGILAIVVTVGFFGILIGMMTGTLKAADNQALLLMLGALGAAWGAIVNFYYGSSNSSQTKDGTIATLAKK